MPSLKEVKNRINSVQSTRKITSAMKMVASSKLHKAQQTIENIYPYELHLNNIMSRFMADNEEIESAYTRVQKVQRVAVAPISSNSSLCGGFNQNIIRYVKQLIDKFKEEHIDYTIFPIGKKIGEAIKKWGATFDDDHAELLNHISYKNATLLAQKFMDAFVVGEFDKVILVYNHFKNTSLQVLTDETFLPIDTAHFATNGMQPRTNLDFIIEPSVREIYESLIPTALHLKFYTTLCDSLASEHAARIMAMQVATDNADNLLQELTLTYNKTRQQAITNELLDIVGGSFH